MLSLCNHFLILLLVCLAASLVPTDVPSEHASNACKDPPCNYDPASETIIQSPFDEKCTVSAQCVGIATAAPFCYSGKCYYQSQLALGNFVTKRKTKRAAGSNIRKFIWNTTLENSAHSFALTNPSKHSNINDIGENLFWHWSTRPGDFNKYGPQAAHSWIQEFHEKYWDSNILTNALFGSGVGHATQMVWADTYQIGCAVTNFKEVHKKTGRPITKICVVCHYWPKGNYLNEPIYLEGSPCSKCESKKCDKNSGLCI
ncbi:unnamed protein product [Caenorhabditis brenneri]